MIYLYSIILNIVFGVSLVSLFVRLPQRRSSIVLIFSLGILVGLTCLGAIYGVIAFFFQAVYDLRLIIDTIITVTVFIFAWRKKTFKQIVHFISSFRRIDIRRIDIFDLIIIFYGIFWMCKFIENLIFSQPDGGWDAWAMWNLKSRTLMLSGGDISTVMLNGYEHSDYPLLLPYINARMLQSYGSITTIVPQITVFLFYISYMGIFMSSIALLKGRISAYCIMLLVFAAPYQMVILAKQTACGPLFTMFLALVFVTYFNETSVKEASAETEENKHRYHISYIIVGVLLGSLIMIKNEGLLLTIAFLSAYFLFRFMEKRFSLIPKELLKICMGAFVFLILFFAVKICYPVENDVISGKTLERLKQLFDITRYKLIGIYLFKEIISDNWLWLPILLSIAPFVLGLIPNWKKATILILLPVFIAFVGYMAIYLITPHDLNWHLDTSFDRIIAHITPAYLIYLIAISKKPRSSISYAHLYRAVAAHQKDVCTRG